MTVALATFVMRHLDVKDSIELLIRHAQPCSKASEPYLRAVACRVLSGVEKIGAKWLNEQVRRAIRHR